MAAWTTSPPHEFILNQFSYAIGENSCWLGHGLGTATNAARIFGKVTLIEIYYPKLIYEIGLLGCLALFGLLGGGLTTLMFVTFKESRSLQAKRLRGYGIGLWLFLLLISYNPYHYSSDVDPVFIPISN